MEICFYDDDDDAWVVQYNEFYLFYFGEFEWGGGYGFGYTISLVTVNTPERTDCSKCSHRSTSLLFFFFRFSNFLWMKADSYL